MATALWTPERTRIICRDSAAPISLKVFALFYIHILWIDVERIGRENHRPNWNSPSHDWNSPSLADDEKKWFPKECFPNGISFNAASIEASIEWRAIYDSLNNASFNSGILNLQRSQHFGLGWYSSVKKLPMTTAISALPGTFHIIII